MALYNYLGNSQANNANLPFAAYDPKGMRFEFEQSDNAFTYSSVTNVGGKARLVIALASPQWPSIGSRFTVTGTYSGVYRVLDTDEATYVTIDAPFATTGTGTGKAILGGWIWAVDVSDTSLGTYSRLAAFKIRPRQDGKFTVDITAFIQSVFGRMSGENYDSATSEWKGFHKFFKIIDQTGANINTGLSLVFRACDWRFISSPILPETPERFIFFCDAKTLYRSVTGIIDWVLTYNHTTQETYLLSAVQVDELVVSNLVDNVIDYTPCSSFPAYQIAWLNRAGFIQSYIFTGTPIEKRESDDEIIAVDGAGVEYMTGIMPENYDTVEMSTGKISSQQAETLWRVRDSIQAWDTNNANPNAWLPIIIERGNFTKIDHGLNTHEIKFTFRYAQRLTMARQ